MEKTMELNFMHCFKQMPIMSGSLAYVRKQRKQNKSICRKLQTMLLHKRNLDITEEDHLVLLITCTSEMTNGRNILVGRLTEQIYPEQEKPKTGGLGSTRYENWSYPCRFFSGSCCFFLSYCYSIEN